MSTRASTGLGLGLGLSLSGGMGGRRVNPLVTAWQSAGGSADDTTITAMQTFANAIRGVAPKLQRLNLQTGNDLASVAVPLIGEGLDALTNFSGANYTPTGGLVSATGRTAGTGIAASSLSPSDVSLGVFRHGFDGGSTIVAGTTSATSGLGIRRASNGGTSNGVAGGYVRDFQPTMLRYTSMRGLISLSATEAGVGYYKNGHLQWRHAAASAGVFSGQELLMPTGADTAQYTGYYIGTALTDSEMLTLSNAWRAYNTAIGRAATETASQYVFVGASHTRGIGSGSTIVTVPYPNALATLRGWGTGGVADAHNLGVSGRTMATIVGEGSVVDEIKYPLSANGDNWLILWAGTNDLMNENKSAAELLASYESYCAARIAAGWKVLVLTLLPNITYVATYTANYNTQAPVVNAAMKSDPRFSNGTLAHGLVLVDEHPDMQDTTNAIYFNDGLHMTNAGYAVPAALVDAKLDALGVA